MKNSSYASLDFIQWLKTNIQHIHYNFDFALDISIEIKSQVAARFLCSRWNIDEESINKHYRDSYT